MGSECDLDEISRKLQYDRVSHRGECDTPQRFAQAWDASPSDYAHEPTSDPEVIARIVDLMMNLASVLSDVSLQMFTFGGQNRNFVFVFCILSITGTDLMVRSAFMNM